MINNTEYAPQNFNEQFEEEKRKYQLTSKDEEWKEAVVNAEDEPCLSGRIKFLLDYSKDDTGKENIKTFKTCTGNAKKLLNAPENLFERLMMNDKESSYPCQLEDMAPSKQDKTTFMIVKVEQFTFSNKGRDNRDFGWLRLLNDYPDSYEDPRKSSLEDCQKVCKMLMLMNTQPDSVSPDPNIEEWKKMLIDCPALIDYCSGSILYKVTFNKEGNASIFLSTGKNNQLFGKRNKISEIYTRYLYEKLGDNKNGWEYVEWSYSNEMKSIDTYMKKGDCTIRRKGDKWEITGLNAQYNEVGFPFTDLINTINS